MGNARRLSEMPATEVYYDPEHRQICIRQEDPMRDEAEVVNSEARSLSENSHLGLVAVDSDTSSAPLPAVPSWTSRWERLGQTPP